MNRIKTSPRKYISEFRSSPARWSGRMDASAFHPPGLPKRLRSSGQKTILHLTVETEDMTVLERIRAALPEGSRMQVLQAANGEAHTPEGDAPVSDDISARFAEMTLRQRDILALLLQKLSNKEIGRKLGLSHFTVRNHVSQLLRLLDVSSRKAAIARFAGSMPWADRFPSAAE